VILQVLEFAKSYSEINKSDYEKFVNAIESGRIEATLE